MNFHFIFFVFIPVFAVNAETFVSTCGSDGTYFANPDDCASYFQCANGVPYLQYCAPSHDQSLVFDPNLNVCVWPSEYDCTKSLKSTEPPEVKTTDPSGITTDPTVGTTNPPERATEPSETVDPCNGESYLVNIDDCSSFYQCTNGVPELVHCPSTYEGSLVFDPTLNVCVWPSEYDCTKSLKSTEPPEVKTTEPSVMTTDPAAGTTNPPERATEPSETVDPCNGESYLVNIDDCSSFYQCTNGVPELVHCPPTHDGSLVFDPTLNVCVWPSEYDCTKSLKSTEPPEVKTTEPSVMTTDPAAGTTNPPERATEPSETVDPCNGESYLVNIDDCSSFYQCTNGVPELVHCPSTYEGSLVFDPTLNVCVWPSEYDCTKSLKSTEPPEVKTTEPSVMTTDPAAGTTNPPERATEPSETVDPCNGESYLVNIDDCSSFYQCTNGVPELVHCPPTHDGSLVFDPTLNVCVWPSEYDCTKSLKSTEPPEVKTTEPSVMTTDPAAGTTNPPERATEPSETVDPCNGESYLVNIDDCSSFYQCTNGVPELVHCPSTYEGSLVFDPTLNVCVWPSEYDCTKSLKSTEPPEVKTTEPSVMTTDPAAGTTNPPERATEPSETVDPCNGDSYLVNIDDCSSFYQCTNGVPELVHCPPTHDGSLVFDPTLNVCVWPSEYDCTKSLKSTEPPEVKTTEPSVMTTDPAAGTTNPPERATEPSETVDPCNGESYLVNIDDCSSFYQCTNGVPELVHCPPTHDGSLVFDPTLNVCVWPSEYDCTKSLKSTEPPEVKTTEPSVMTTDPAAGTTNPPERATEPSETVDPCNGESYLVNIDDCSSFYQCTNGVPELVHCPSTYEGSLVFDPTLNVCVWPSEYDCTKSLKSTEPPEAKTTEPPEKITEPPGNTTQPPVMTTEPLEIATDPTEMATELPTKTTKPSEITTEPPKSSTEPPKTTTEPTERTSEPTVKTTENTNKTTERPIGTTEPSVTATEHPIRTTEPSVTATEPPKITTELPEITTKSPEITSEPSERTTESSVITTPEMKTEPPEVTAEPPAITTEPPETVDPCRGHTFLENPDDCSSFYYCMDGVPELLDCPSSLDGSLVFDPSLNICVSTSEYDCTKLLTTTEPPEITTEPKETLDPCLGHTFLENPDDCSSFYYCMDGVPELLDCPSTLDGSLVFDPSLNFCVSTSEYDCTKSVTATEPLETTTEPPIVTQPTQTVTDAPQTTREIPQTKTEPPPNTTSSPGATTSYPEIINPCIEFSHPTTCLQSSNNCSFCFDTCFRDDSVDKTRCDKYENLLNAGCHSFTLNRKEYESVVTTRTNCSTWLPLEPGKKRNFSVTFSLEKHPLDLYYLMDFTVSMSNDKENLVRLSSGLLNTLANLTDNFHIGFGTFADKPKLPLGARGDYSFHNDLPLTAETDGFVRKISEIPIKNGGDGPEAHADALAQVIECEEQIGWRSNARHVVLLATDIYFHVAGDGSTANITAPYVEGCYLDSLGAYTEELTMDYPSVEQLAKAFSVKQATTTVIFATSSHTVALYNEIASHFKSAFVGILKEDSSNVLELINDEFAKIESRMEIEKSDTSDSVSFKYFSNCINFDDERETAICESLPKAGEVTFVVEIDLSECPTDKDETGMVFTLNPVGLPVSIEVELSYLCD